MVIENIARVAVKRTFREFIRDHRSVLETIALFTFPSLLIKEVNKNSKEYSKEHRLMAYTLIIAVDAVNKSGLGYVAYNYFQ